MLRERGLQPVAAPLAREADAVRAELPEATLLPSVALGVYAALARVTPSPVVELNRAVAVAMADGPAAGLAIVDALREVPSLRDYRLLPSTRADLLRRLGRFADARTEYERALSLTANRAPARSRLQASTTNASSWSSSRFTQIRIAWNVRVAGSIR